MTTDWELAAEVATAIRSYTISCSSLPTFSDRMRAMTKTTEAIVAIESGDPDRMRKALEELTKP